MLIAETLPLLLRYTWLSFRTLLKLARRLIEDPCSKLQGIFDRKEVCHFQIRSLTPQQATGNALAFSVHALLFQNRHQTGS